MWDVHMNGNDWVSMPRLIARELILPQPVCQEGLSPMVSGSCGKVPPHIAHTHLAIEGVLDKGVSGQPDYILWPDCWTMKIQD